MDTISPPTIVVTMECALCQTTGSLSVPAEGYDRWRRHEAHIQDCLPELTPAQREFLITGFCDPCQEFLFAAPEVDE